MRAIGDPLSGAGSSVIGRLTEWRSLYSGAPFGGLKPLSVLACRIARPRIPIMSFVHCPAGSRPFPVIFPIQVFSIWGPDHKIKHWGLLFRIQLMRLFFLFNTSIKLYATANHQIQYPLHTRAHRSCKHKNHLLKHKLRA